jgi:hypothetical protein
MGAHLAGGADLAGLPPRCADAFADAPAHRRLTRPVIPSGSLPMGRRTRAARPIPRLEAGRCHVVPARTRRSMTRGLPGRVCATGHCCHGSGDGGSRLVPGGNGQRCRPPARLPADRGGGDERVTASVCRCSSRSSQDITGVTPGGGTVRLSRLIRVLRLIRGTGMHRIRHEARIHHENVAEAADVRGATPRPGLVAPRLPEEGCSDPRSRDLGPEKQPAAQPTG